jgi:hypothetical protein
MRIFIFLTFTVIVSGFTYFAIAQEGSNSTEKAYERGYDQCIEAAELAEEYDTAFAECMAKLGLEPFETEETLSEEVIEEEVIEEELSDEASNIEESSEKSAN